MTRTQFLQSATALLTAPFASLLPTRESRGEDEPEQDLTLQTDPSWANEPAWVTGVDEGVTKEYVDRQSREGRKDVHGPWELRVNGEKVGEVTISGMVDW